MICKMCSAGGAVNLAAHNLKARDPGNPVLLGLLQQAEVLHEMCYDHNCACQHRSNVVEGIDWNRVNTGVRNYEEDTTA